jgi:hypothetical protein
MLLLINLRSIVWIFDRQKLDWTFRDNTMRQKGQRSNARSRGRGDTLYCKLKIAKCKGQNFIKNQGARIQGS